MKRLLWLLVLAACEHGSHDKPAIAPAVPVTAPAPLAPLACGDKTCTGTEICVEVRDSGGAAPPAGQSNQSIAMQCAPGSMEGPGTSCGPIENRHQTCAEMKPSAPPPPPPPPPPGITAPITCGELTCKGNEICIETERTGGAAPRPGTQPGVAIRYRCSASPDPGCTPVHDHRQRCFQEIPRAAPHH
jgi:hypothetical protein